ncbi:hypothetical protein HW988_05195 [Bdellovibrio sp. KM01]|nr:hypothetical protein HW988_05195 [Bdellovibrio sp. KM01]
MKIIILILLAGSHVEASCPADPKNYVSGDFTVISIEKATRTCSYNEKGSSIKPIEIEQDGCVIKMRTVGELREDKGHDDKPKDGVFVVGATGSACDSKVGTKVTYSLSYNRYRCCQIAGLRGLEDRACKIKPKSDFIKVQKEEFNICHWHDVEWVIQKQ